MPATTHHPRAARRPTGFTRAQQARYRPLVERAWQEDCRRAGREPADRAARNAWYRRQLLDVLQVYTTKQCDRVDDFDALMLHFALLAGDDSAAAYYTVAAERRHLKAIRDMLRREHRPESYAEAIADRMGFGHDLGNIPAKHLRKLRIALQKDLRRHYSPEPAWNTARR